MNKEKALKNQGLEFREDIPNGGGTTNVRTFAKEELKNKKHVQAGVASENFIQLSGVLRQYIN